MKKLVIVSLMLIATGCATSSQKATAYCDTNWSGRYDSWQSCYDRQLPEYSTPSAASALVGGIGKGMTQNNGQINCTTFGNQTNCTQH